MKKTSSKIKRICVVSFLSVISIIFSILGKFFSLPFLRIEISDAPAVAASLFFGLPSGVIIVFIVSFIRAIFFSVAGWPGFVLRIESIIYITFISLCKDIKKKYFYIILGIILYLIVKIPSSYIFWMYFIKIPFNTMRYVIYNIFFTNFIKVILNSFLGFYIFKILNKNI